MRVWHTTECFRKERKHLQEPGLAKNTLQRPVRRKRLVCAAYGFSMCEELRR